MLDARAELARNRIRNVLRVLRDEIDADPLRPDKAHDLFDLFKQRLGRVVEEEMRLVEEENELRLFRIADFGKFLKKLRQHPEEECRVEFRRLHQAVGGEDVDDAAPVAVDMNEIVKLKRRFAEEILPALLFKRQEAPLDRADRRLRDVSVFQRQFVCALADIDQQRAQILQVDQREAVVVSDAERERQDAFLRLVKVQQPREEQRPHLGHRRAYGMALLAEKVPEDDRRGFRRVRVKPDFLRPRDEEILHIARHGDAGKIALHIRREDGNARARKAFRKDLQGDRLAGAGRPRDEPVAVGVFQRKILRACAPADKKAVIRHGS